MTKSNLAKVQNQRNKIIPPGDAEPCAATIKTYACFDWPSLTIAGRVKFRAGFVVTNDPDLQGIIEKATGFGSQIRDVTEAAQRAIAMAEGSKLYLCFNNPSLSIERRLTFRNGVFATENEDLQQLIEHFPGFGTQIRELTQKVMLEAAADQMKAPGEHYQNACEA